MPAAWVDPVARVVVALGLVVAAVLGPVAAVTPPAAAALPTVSPCDLVSPLLRPACQAAGDIAAVPGLLGDPVGAIAGSAGDAAMRAVTGFVVDGAVWFLGRVATVVTASTDVTVQAPWFAGHYRQMVALAAVVATALLIFTGAGALLHRDPHRMVSAVGMTAAAGVGTGMVLGIVSLLVAVSDTISAQLAAGLSTDSASTLDGLATSIAGLTDAAPGPSGVPLLAVLVAAGMAVLGAFAVWVELLLREGAIYAAVLFYPLALAGTAWSGSRSWARRLAKTLVALIFAKVVIVALIALAAAGLAAPAATPAGDGAAYGGVLAGGVLLVLAAFSPFVLIRLVASFDDAVDGANDMRGMRRSGTAPVQSAGRRLSAAAHSGGGGGGGLRVAPGPSAARAAGAGGGTAGAAGVPVAAAMAAASAPAAAGRAAGTRLATATPAGGTS